MFLIINYLSIEALVVFYTKAGGYILTTGCFDMKVYTISCVGGGGVCLQTPWHCK